MNEAEKEWAKDNVTDERVGGIEPPFRLTKKTDDPQGATRISAGGNLTTEQYLVYRGDLPVVKMILENCLMVVTAKIEMEKQQTAPAEKRIITDIT